MSPRLLMFCVALLACGTSFSEDVFKCKRSDGTLVYQATSCETGETRQTINRQLSSTLPLGVPGSDAEQVSKIAREAANTLRQRRAKHDAYMQRLVRQFEARQLACEESRQKLAEVRTAQRQRGRSNPNELTNAVSMMREACSR